MFQAMLASSGSEIPSTTGTAMFNVDCMANCPPPPPLVPLQPRQMPMTPLNNNRADDNENESESSDSSDDEDSSQNEEDGASEPTGPVPIVQQQLLAHQRNMVAYRQPTGQHLTTLDASVQRGTASAYYQSQQQQQQQQSTFIQQQASNAQFVAANNYRQQTPQNSTMQNRAVPPPQQAPQEPSLPALPNNQPTPSGPDPPPRSRAAYNRYQREFLNACFEQIHYPTRIQRDAISRCLGGVVNQNQIKVWFQNARRRAVLRGVKFPPGRINPSEPNNSTTPMPPPQNVSGPGSEMVDTYFATIRHFVKQIVDLSESQSQGPNNLPQDNRNRPLAGNKRPRPSADSDDEDEEITRPPVEKRSGVVATPPRNVVIRPSVEQTSSASSTAAACISPNTTTESGIISNSFQSSQIVVDRGDSSEEERSGSSAGQPAPSPSDIRSYMDSRASSGVMSSLSNYTSPPYNSAPLAGSTPNNNNSVSSYQNNQTFCGLLDQQVAFANAVRAAQTAQQSYYTQLMMQQSGSGNSTQLGSQQTAASNALVQSFVQPIAQRVHSVANFVQPDVPRSSCAFSSQTSDVTRNCQPFPTNFYAHYGSGYSPAVQSSFTGQTSYNAYSAIQNVAPAAYHSYFSNPAGQPSINAAGFVAQLAAQLSTPSVIPSSASSSGSASPSDDQQGSPSDQQ